MCLENKHNLYKVLQENGVDMTEANKFWKQWAPLRKDIVSNIRPFDLEGNEAKAPLASKLTTASAEAKTPAQAIAKEKAQQLISNIESAMEKSQGLEEGSLKGTIGAETKSQMEKLTSAQQEKIDMKKVLDETNKEVKSKLAETKSELGNQKFNAMKKADRRALIKKWIGIAATTAIGGELIKHGLTLIP